MDYPRSYPNANLHKGRFTNGILRDNIPPSADTAEWANQVTDEILAVILDAGLTPSEQSSAQLRDAINKKIATVQLLAQQALNTSSGFASMLAGKLDKTATAAAAVILATPRKINGVAFDGSKDITISAVDQTARDAAAAATANANTRLLASANAASATRLATARKINGIAFDGSKDIDIAIIDQPARDSADIASLTANNAVYAIERDVALSKHLNAIGNIAIDFNLACSHTLALGGNVFLSPIYTDVANTEGLFLLRVSQPTNGVVYSIAWWSGITWITAGGLAPSAPGTNGVSEYIFTYSEGRWFGRKGATK